MKTMRKTLCTLLAVLMVLSTLPASAVAAAGTEPTLSASFSYVNPLYGGTAEKDALTVSGEKSAYTLNSAASSDAVTLAAEDYDYLEELEKTSSDLRSGLSNRRNTYRVSIMIPIEDVTEENVEAVAYDIFNWALAHTGEPDEGDYLALNIVNTQISVEAFDKGDLARLEYTFETTYLTTQEQESAVFNAIFGIISELHAYDTSAYRNLCNIYDYVCRNISYDAEHADDQDYLLQYSAYGAAVDKTCANSGYALLMYRIALELGIDCRIIPGTDNGEDHFWNIVLLDDLYYNMDTAWDAGKEDYQYCLKGSSDFAGHTRAEDYDSQDFHEYYPMGSSTYTPPECDHDYTIEVIEPTCTDSGYSIFTCNQCGDKYRGDEVAPLGHDPVVDPEVPPTCTESGLTEGSHCSRCNITIVRQEFIPASHTKDETAENIITSPTCTEDGYTTYICSVCGETFVDDYVPAIGHNFVDGECTNCGSHQAPKLLSIYSRVQTSCKATWTVLEGVSGYELWRTETPDDDESWIRVKTIHDSSQDRYTNQGLTVGVTYYYKVRAFIDNEDGARSYSDFSEVKYMPAAVVFDDVYSNATDNMRILWNKIGGAHGYQIWRLNDDGSWKIIKTLGDKGNTLTNNQGTTTAYSNTGLEAGKRYTYRMRAFSIPEDGVKVFGAYSDAFTAAVKPDIPIVTATSPKAGRVLLEWEPVNGASGYQIWMSDMYTDYHIIKTITDGSITSYTKSGLDTGYNYSFRVRAYVEVNGKKTYGRFADFEVSV